MSALPITFTLPPLVRDNPATSNRRTKAARRATHHSGIHTVPSSSTTGAGNLRFDFASLYHTYRRRIYSQCVCMLHNYDDAEDAAQEVFLQLFRKVHTFRGESSFSTWLYRLTTNCVLMEIRRRRHSRRESTCPQAGIGADIGDAVLDRPPDSFQAPSTHIFDRVSITVAMSQLPTGYQRIFQLHDVEGYTHEEISTTLGIRVGTSKSQLHKARLRMRQLLQTAERGIGNSFPA